MAKEKGVPMAWAAAMFAGDYENALVAATPGGIEAQEAAGQRALVESTHLPLKMGKREPYEALGFTFGEAVDNLFINATLPDGWTIRATDHSMWSDILDEKGRRRAGVFYKAAFYDRDAHMDLDCFIGTGTRYYDATGTECPWDKATLRRFTVKTKNDEVLFESSMFGDRDWDAQDAARAECSAWLKENRPDHSNPVAYWE